jgi:hypothetical protein
MPGAMTTDAEQLQVIPTSPDTSWLFWMTLCFGSFLAIFAPYRFCSGALILTLYVSGPGKGVEDVYL